MKNTMERAYKNQVHLNRKLLPSQQQQAQQKSCAASPTSGEEFAAAPLSVRPDNVGSIELPRITSADKEARPAAH